MSGIGKVFVVLNLVFSLVIVGAAAVYLSHAKNWKDQHDSVNTVFTAEKKAWDTARSELTTQVDNWEKDANSKQNDVERLELQVSDLDGQLKSEKNDNQQLRDDLTKFQNTLNDFQTNMNNLNSRNNELVDQNSTLRTEALDAKEAERKAKENLIRVQGELASSQEQINSLEQRVTAIDKEKETLTNQLEVAKKQGFDINALIAPPEISAYVQEVDTELGFVVLSVGSDDKVKKGFVFHVYRGKSYLGEVQVDDVYPDSCAAHVKFIVKNEQFQVNDKATTIL